MRIWHIDEHNKPFCFRFCAKNLTLLDMILLCINKAHYGTNTRSNAAREITPMADPWIGR
jgi:hypothetical protein